MASVAQRLHERIAVVSGGASGIGRAAAKRLAAEGAIVEILDRDDAGSTCAEIAVAGGTATCGLCDVTDDGQIAAAVEAIRGRRGRVDILVNSAGVLTDRRPWLTRSREELERFMQVNYFGVFALAKAIYPLILPSPCGRIIVVGSRTVFMGNPGMSGYVESKAAVTVFVRVLAREAGEHGITVNAVAPGMIATPGTRAHSDEADFDRMVGIQAIKRRVAPEHVADLIAFLASDDAEMITGQTIVCDGGGFFN
jgi:NAD(P)-dependent dehydrogenase (short-subunit alcohol dehydrogenase family)